MFGKAFFFPPILQLWCILQQNSFVHLSCTEFYFIFVTKWWKFGPQKKNWWSFLLLFFKLFYLIIHGFANNIFEGPLGAVWTRNPNPKP
jgi:hypothetical protein